MFSDLVRLDFLERVTERDVPEFFRSALDLGWVAEPGGAWLLRFFSDGYQGDRSSYSDLTGYEAAVNGRAIPDLDLKVNDSGRIETLARRAYGFAHGALLKLHQIPDAPPASAYISIGPTLYDENIVTGSVTFCMRRDDEEPYLSDLSKVTTAGVLVVESEDCISPLG